MIVKTELVQFLKLEFLFHISNYRINDYLPLQCISLIFFLAIIAKRKIKASMI